MMKSKTLPNHQAVHDYIKDLSGDSYSYARVTLMIAGKVEAQITQTMLDAIRQRMNLWLPKHHSLFTKPYTTTIISEWSVTKFRKIRLEVRKDFVGFMPVTYYITLIDDKEV